ncbi:nuclear pore complex protein DDB_G0274915-like, partial [Musca vetustissima]|uniref:nuclear pore complex protein DDB_G0274915-like n=1 Tax=Musca vetustissima TaxID=27455 RepID=UPI002AB7A068
MGLSNNDDAMNKIPLKSGVDDEEKNGGEFIHDTATAEEARREQRRVKLLNLMKKLTIGIICFIGIALISYVIISLCFSDDNSNTNGPAVASTTSTSPLDNGSNGSDISSNNQILSASILGAGGVATPTTALPPSSQQPTTGASVTSGTTTPAAATTAEKDAATVVESSDDDGKVTTEVTDNSLLKDEPILEKNFTSNLGVYEKAAVCSDKPVCSQIG